MKRFILKIRLKYHKIMRKYYEKRAYRHKEIVINKILPAFYGDLEFELKER